MLPETQVARRPTEQVAVDGRFHWCVPDILCAGFCATGTVSRDAPWIACFWLGSARWLPGPRTLIYLFNFSQRMLYGYAACSPCSQRAELCRATAAYASTEVVPSPPSMPFHHGGRRGCRPYNAAGPPDLNIDPTAWGGNRESSPYPAQASWGITLFCLFVCTSLEHTSCWVFVGWLVVVLRCASKHIPMAARLILSTATA